MDELEQRFEIALSKAQALFVNDRLKFVRVDEPAVITTKAQEVNLSHQQREAWAVNSIKFACIRILQKTLEKRDDDPETYPVKVSRRELEVLENVTTNSLEDRDIQRGIDLVIQPHLLECRKWDVLAEGLPPAETSDSITSKDVIERLSGKEEGDGQAGDSGPDRRADRRLRRPR